MAHTDRRPVMHYTKVEKTEIRRALWRRDRRGVQAALRVGDEDRASQRLRNSEGRHTW